MNIKFLGHAAFLITSEAGVRIVTDPYEPGGYNGAVGYDPITEAAAVVTISHEHADHNFARGVPGNPSVVRGLGHHQAAGISFLGVASYHDRIQGRARGSNTIFVFEADDLRVCHLGDLGHVLTVEQVAQVGPVDVLLLPVGGEATINARAATEVAGQLRARLIIPMHFKTPKIRFPFAPVDDFLRGKENVRRPGGSEIAVTKGNLPSEPQIVVLEPAL